MTNQLKRQIHIPAAVMMGLGSIVGTGVFVTLPILASNLHGQVISATIVAAFVALFNGLSSAQLAANHPVSGGTYEYGYRWLHPSLGYIAGVAFVLAKSASAATAALGIIHYVWPTASQDSWLPILAALAVIGVITSIVIAGIRISSQFNIVLVSITLLALISFFGYALSVRGGGVGNIVSKDFSLAEFLEACALMFVAYTGYGRIATLGEEIVNPRRSIPTAIVITLVVSTLVYAMVAVASSIMSTSTTAQVSPTSVNLIALASNSDNSSWVRNFVIVGAAAAMSGVLLNLVLGLSRVVLAIARRRDISERFARLDRHQSPTTAVVVVGLIIAGICLLGDVKMTWSLSAFTVLIYYSLTNLAAIRLKPEERFYPAFIPWAGLASCLSLAFWVQPSAWLIGSGVLFISLVWYFVNKRLFSCKLTERDRV